MSSSHGPGVRGRSFTKGNPGRKRGPRKKVSLISAVLLEGEQPEVLRLAMESAKRGKVSMLKFLLARWLPRERLIKIDLPRTVSTNNALTTLQHILHAVSAGTISPAEDAVLTALLIPFIGRNAGKPLGFARCRVTVPPNPLRK